MTQNACATNELTQRSGTVGESTRATFVATARAAQSCTDPRAYRGPYPILSHRTMAEVMAGRAHHEALTA